MQAGQRFRGAHPDAYGQGSVKRGRRRPALLAPPTHPGLSQTQLRRPILHPWLPGELRMLRAVGMAVPPAAQALGCSQGGRTQPRRPAWGGWGAGQGIGVSVSLAVKKGWGTPCPSVPAAEARLLEPGSLGPLGRAARPCRAPGNSPLLLCPREPSSAAEGRGGVRSVEPSPFGPLFPPPLAPPQSRARALATRATASREPGGPKPCGEGPPCRRL